MTLATSTIYNKFRRELKTKLEALKNDSGEAIQMSSGVIAIGGALFKKVYTGRLYIDFIKQDNIPAVYCTLGSGEFTNFDRANNSAIERSLTLTIIIAKSFNTQADCDTIEDILEYYRSKVIQVLNSCKEEYGNFIDVVTVSVDYTDTIEGLEGALGNPFRVTTVEANTHRLGGNI